MMRWIALALALLAGPALAQQTGGGGGGATTFANPTAVVGASAVNGSATTAMRSDAAPPIDLTFSPTWTGAHTWALGTITTNIKAINITGTFNNAATTFDAPLFMNITNTASHGGTLLADLQVGSNSVFSVDFNGNLLFGGALRTGSVGAVSAGGNVFAGLDDNTRGQILFGTASDARLLRRGANSIQLGASDAATAVAQTFGVQGVVAGTSNTAGADFTIAGSQGTGTGLGGKLVFQTAPAGTTGTAQNAEQAVLSLDANSHAKFSSAAIPTIGTCGTGSPTITAGSTDVAGEATIGTTATACTISFKIAYAAAPFCVVTDKTNLSHLTSYTISTAAIVLTMTSNSGDVIEYVCSGA